jgi:APA family basic amino acid/polyamine antiporter
MARDIGSAAWLLVIWLVTGLITVAAALSYGELAEWCQKGGGLYTFNVLMVD